MPLLFTVNQCSVRLTWQSKKKDSYSNNIYPVKFSILHILRIIQQEDIIWRYISFPFNCFRVYLTCVLSLPLSPSHRGCIREAAREDVFFPDAPQKATSVSDEHVANHSCINVQLASTAVETFDGVYLMPGRQILTICQVPFVFYPDKQALMTVISAEQRCLQYSSVFSLLPV